LSRVLTDLLGALVTGGSVCVTFSGQAARLDSLAAGTYFVEVSDNGNDQTGGYSLLMQTPVP
jgi:hypothetical protein